MSGPRPSAFNSPLESGVRALAVLVPAYPQAYDLGRLVSFDHLIVHTADVGGPQSLHPRLPLRAAELLVRRGIVEQGLNLMLHRGLIERATSTRGIEYRAGEQAGSIMAAFETPYLVELRERGEWVSQTCGQLSEDGLRDLMSRIFGEWIADFRSVQHEMGV